MRTNFLSDNPSSDDFPLPAPIHNVKMTLLKPGHQTCCPMNLPPLSAFILSSVKRPKLSFVNEWIQNHLPHQECPGVLVRCVMMTPSPVQPQLMHRTELKDILKISENASLSLLIYIRVVQSCHLLVCLFIYRHFTAKLAISEYDR